MDLSYLRKEFVGIGYSKARLEYLKKEIASGKEYYNFEEFYLYWLKIETTFQEVNKYEKIGKPKTVERIAHIFNLLKDEEEPSVKDESEEDTDTIPQAEPPIVEITKGKLSLRPYLELAGDASISNRHKSNIMCVGFSAYQRREFVLYMEDLLAKEDEEQHQNNSKPVPPTSEKQSRSQSSSNGGSSLSQSSFAQCFRHAKGHLPRSQYVARLAALSDSGLGQANVEALFVKWASGVAPVKDEKDQDDDLILENVEGSIDGSCFSSVCTINPSDQGSVPFPVAHCRQQKENLTSLLGITFYVPFLALFILFFLTGKNLLEGYSMTARINDIFDREIIADIDSCNNSLAARDPGDPNYLSSCIIQDKKNMPFSEVANQEDLQTWMNVIVNRLWTTRTARYDTMASTTYDSARSSIDGFNYGVGALQFRSIRMNYENESTHYDFFIDDPSQREDLEKLFFPRHEGGYGLRYKRFKPSRVHKDAFGPMRVGTPLQNNLTTSSAYFPLLSTQEQNEVLGEANQAFRYRSCEELNDTESYTGRLHDAYPCGGFAFNIPYNFSLSQAASLLTIVLENNWVDIQTRGVITNAVFFNVNEGMFLYYRLMAEATAGGAFVPTHHHILAERFHFELEKIRYIVVFIIFTVSLIAYFIQFIVSYHRDIVFRKTLVASSGVFSHLRAMCYVLVSNPWYLIDLANYMMFIAAWILRVYWVMECEKLDVHSFNQLEYFPPGVAKISEIHMLLAFLDSCNILLCFFTIMKYIKLLKILEILSNTMSNALQDLTGIAFAFTVLFLGFVFAAYVAYGNDVRDFSSLDYTASTLLRTLFGDMDYNALRDARPIFTPIYFFFFIIFVILTLLNMIIAVLTGAYESIQSEELNKADVEAVIRNDLKCALAPPHRSFFQWIGQTTFAREISYRCRACCLNTDGVVGFGSHRNPRQFYSQMEQILFKLHYGSVKSSREHAIFLHRILNFHVRKKCFSPFFEVERLRVRGPTKHFREHIVEVFGKDRAAWFMQLFVWLPYVVLDMEPLELVLGIVDEFTKWRAYVGRYAVTEEKEEEDETAAGEQQGEIDELLLGLETAVSEQPSQEENRIPRNVLNCNADENQFTTGDYVEEVVRSLRAVAFFSGKVLNSLQDLLPLVGTCEKISAYQQSWLSEQKELLQNESLDTVTKEWLSVPSHVVFGNVGSVRHEWSRHLAGIFRSLLRCRVQAKIRAYSSGWSVEQRAVLRRIQQSRENVGEEHEGVKQQLASGESSAVVDFAPPTPFHKIPLEEFCGIWKIATQSGISQNRKEVIRNVSVLEDVEEHRAVVESSEPVAETATTEQPHTREPVEDQKPGEAQSGKEQQCYVNGNEFLDCCSNDPGLHALHSFNLMYFENQLRKAKDQLHLSIYIPFLILFTFFLADDKGLGDAIWMMSSISNEMYQQEYYVRGDPKMRHVESMRTTEELYSWCNSSLIGLLVDDSVAGPGRLDTAGTFAVGAIKLRQVRGTFTSCDSSPDDVSASLNNPPAPNSNRTLTWLQRTQQELAEGCVINWDLSGVNMSSYGIGAETNPTATAALFAPYFSASGLSLSLAEQQVIIAQVQEGFHYRSAADLNGYGVIIGKNSYYFGDGYGVFLPLNQSTEQLKLMIKLLEEFQWIDRSTRGVFAEVLFYNYNINMFIVARFIVELTAGGSWLPMESYTSFRVWSARFQPPQTLVFLGIFWLMILGYIIGFFVEFHAAYKARQAELGTKGRFFSTVSYVFGSSWWWSIDLLNYTAFAVVWSMRAWVMSQGLADINIVLPGKYPDSVEKIATISIVVSLLDALNALLCYLKLLYFVKLYPKLSVFLETIGNATKNIFSIVVIMLLCLTGFALAGFGIFGALGESFYTVPNSYATLIRLVTTGDFDEAEALHLERREVFTSFRFCFIFFGQILLFNLFIAVLSEAFNQAKEAIYDDTDFLLIAKYDPEVPFGSTNWKHFFYSLSLWREICYWCASCFYRLKGSPEEESASLEKRLSRLDEIRLHNPRLFWGEMVKLQRMLDFGGPMEQRAAACRFLLLTHQMTTMLSTAFGEERKKYIVGYTKEEWENTSPMSPKSRAKRKEEETRRKEEAEENSKGEDPEEASTLQKISEVLTTNPFEKAFSPTLKEPLQKREDKKQEEDGDELDEEVVASTIHGFKRRTVREYLIETFGEGNWRNLEYFCVTMPQMALSAKKTTLLCDLLAAWHTYKGNAAHYSYPLGRKALPLMSFYPQLKEDVNWSTPHTLVTNQVLELLTARLQCDIEALRQE